MQYVPTVWDVANDTGLCDPHCYAFVWTKEKGIQQVGPLPGDSNSLAYGIGFSCCGRFWPVSAGEIARTAAMTITQFSILDFIFPPFSV